jgi:peroxiredoxin
MMKIGRGLLAILLVAAFMAPYVAVHSAAQATSDASGAPDRIVLLYFHRTERCQSCNNAEQYARDTLNTYFPDEVKSGKLSIQSIDYQKDKEMAKKYNVNMQGLKLAEYRDGQETVKDVSEIWTYVRDKNAYENYLRDVLNKELGR